jgi:hypothetical protein
MKTNVISFGDLNIMKTSARLSMPNLLLRLEGLTVLVIAILGYVRLEGSGLLFIALLLVPDLSALGYLVNTRLGSLSYNAVHTYVFPALLAVLGLALAQPLALQISLIWFAHIGVDRVLGFGLKYPTVFNDTHFQHV